MSSPGHRIFVHGHYGLVPTALRFGLLGTLALQKIREGEDPVRGGGHRQCCLLHEGLVTNGVWESCVFHNPRWVSWKRADTAVHLMRSDMETILCRVPARLGHTDRSGHKLVAASSTATQSM